MVRIIVRILVKHSFGAACHACQQQKLRSAFTAAGVNMPVPDPFEIELRCELTADQERALKTELEGSGVILITDRKLALVEQMKRAIEEVIEDPELLGSQTLRAFLSRRFYYSYSYLSKLFSSTEHLSPEHYLILQKIERAKAYLHFDQLSLSEIAARLHYSSIAHFAHQFKQVTGMTAMEYKRQADGSEKKEGNMQQERENV